jgi:hypothetical protein
LLTINPQTRSADRGERAALEVLGYETARDPELQAVLLFEDSDMAHADGGVGDQNLNNSYLSPRATYAECPPLVGQGVPQDFAIGLIQSGNAER